MREELLIRVERLELPTLARERLPTIDAVLARQPLGTCKKLDQPLRDAALILALFDTGVRIQELLDPRTTDLLFERGLIRVVGKGRKERFMPIGARAMQAVSAYLRRERRPATAGFRASSWALLGSS